MSARDVNGQQMTDEELRDQLVSLLLLGYETTSGVLAWVFYLIHSHPEVKHRLMQELNTLDDLTNPEAITQLPYLTAVCQETLRIHPIALICTPRMVKDSVEIMGQKFTSETVLVPCIYLLRTRTVSSRKISQPKILTLRIFTLRWRLSRLHWCSIFHV